VSIPAGQAEAAALLGRLTGAEPIETHISAVFVGPGAVYKLKKAVRLEFLDFSTLAAREHFTRREYELNHGFAPGLYRGVRAITADGRLDGAGPVLDWVLELAPIPAGDFLSTHPLTQRLLRDLADSIAAMHQALPPLAGRDAVAAFHQVLDGNRAAAERCALPGVAAWHAAALVALERAAPVLAARAAAGFQRRCHGDLHLNNLCLWRGRPTPFDALEFDEELASIDTGYDLAFLLMDLDVTQGRAAANAVLNRYVARTGDAGLVAALPLWLSTRALIRAHVAARPGGEPERYMRYAMAALAPLPPRLVAVGGLQGSGKSTLARALAPGLGAAPGALVLRSDELRKRQAGVAPEQRLPDAAYTAAASARVFAELAALARTALAAGHAVVADAAFLRPEERAQIAAAAAGVAPFTGFWLTAPAETLRARILARQDDASDATPAVLEAALARDPGPLGEWQVLDASTDPAAAAHAILQRPARESC
jgi:aminoglycoside phosphotransferase family enzyme/predicted kinase